MRFLLSAFVAQVAGRDTTATALTWLFYAFAQNPATEAVCVSEVQSLLDPRVESSAESLKSLVQVEAAFLESVRMWPPVPVDLKQCIADSTFPCGTRIAKGTVMVYTPFLLSRLPEFYRSTTGLQHWAQDCQEFKPSRWIVPDSHAASSADEHGDASSGSSHQKILNPSPYEFISFNAGLRSVDARDGGQATQTLKSIRVQVCGASCFLLIRAARGRLCKGVGSGLLRAARSTGA